MGDLSLTVLTNEDARFYSLLGPYLAQREIINAVGGPLYDDSGKVWFVVMDGMALAGFGAILFRDDEAHFCSDYVRPEYRRRGIHNRLVAARLEYAQGRAKRATVTATVAGQFAYKTQGFTPEESRKRPMKNYTRMEKTL